MGRGGHIGFIVGPGGERIARADLPPPGTRRWVPRKKAAVVAAVKGGLITLEEACTRYEMTVEEFIGWEHSYTHYGVSGLRVSEIHHRREEEKV
jgi:hypothetical protein